MGYRFIFGLITCLLLEPPGHLTALQFPESWPNSYIPLSVSDSLATYISIWDTLSSEENAEMFTYSMGLRALSVSRHRPKEQYVLYKNLLLEQMYSLKATGVRVDGPKILTSRSGSAGSARPRTTQGLRFACSARPPRSRPRTPQQSWE